MTLDQNVTLGQLTLYDYVKIYAKPAAVPEPAAALAIVAAMALLPSRRR